VLIVPIRLPGANSSYLYTLEEPSEESSDQVAPVVSLVPVPSSSFGYLQSLPQWESTQSAYKHKYFIWGQAHKRKTFCQYTSFGKLAEENSI
jgi:hypothetical protein